MNCVKNYGKNCAKKDLLLYAVTDRTWLGDETLYQQVEKTLKGGATFIQLREKHLDDTAFLEEAVRHVHGGWRGGLLRAALGEGAFTAGGEVEAAEVMSVERHRAAVCVAEGERGGVAFSGDGV